MAEKSIEEKSRKLASQRPEAGKEFEQMQAAQNQLLEIQAAQKQNLMERRVMANSQAEQNQILAQAANVGAQSVAGNMQLNQATQQAMGRYGLSQPRTSSQTKQRSSEVVTRQNVTIHNNTTNITNNTVPANIGGPVQGRPVQFQQPASQADGGMGKFKNWLNQTFARQEEAAKKRDREYQRRETALTKSSNKMMRKIEEFSKDITKKLDPRNVGRTIGGQLKTILRLVGLGVIAKNFTSILDWLFGAQKKVEKEYIPKIKNFFAWIKGDENAQKPGLITKITGAFNDMFGNLFFGKDFEKYRDKGLLRGMRDFLWNETTNEEERGVLNKAWDKLKEVFQERSKKAKDAITLDKSGTVGDIMRNPGEAFKEFLNNITNYFGVLFGGDMVLSRIQGKIAEEKAVSQSTSDIDTAATYDRSGYQRLSLRKVNGKVRKAYTADSGLLNFDNNINRNDQYIISKHYLDNGHIRRGDLGATAQVSNNLLYHNQAAVSGNINTASVANDLSHLYTEAKSNGEVLVNSANFNIRVKNGVVLGKFLADHGLIREIQKDELWLVLRNRPQEELEKDLKEITPQYKKVAETMRKLRLNDLADLKEGKFNVWGAEVQLPTQIVPDIVGMIERGIIALVEEKIIRPEELSPENGDIKIKDVSSDLKSKGYVWAKPEAISALAYYGYTTEEDRQNKAVSDITFNLSDKNYLGSIQKSLESKTNSETKTYDYDASTMAENKRAANYQIDAPKGVEYNIGTTASAEPNVSTGQHHLTTNEELTTVNQQSTTTSSGGEVAAASGQGPFINAVMPIVTDSLRAAGISEEFAPMLTAQAGLETGWKIGVGTLQKEGKNLSGVIAPKMRGKAGKPGDVVQGGGVGGRDAIYVPNSKPGANSWWTKFRSYKDWASYVIDLVRRKWNAFGGSVEDYPVRLQTPSTNPNFKGQTYAEEGGSYAKSVLALYQSVKNYLKTGKYVPTAVSDVEYSGNVVNPENLESQTQGSEKSFSNFLTKAGETVKSAIHSLSHEVSEGAGWVMDKAGDGVDWEASLHGGTSYYPGPYQKSRAEKYMYAKYTGKDTTGYTIPSSISGGTILNRDEWWAKFFDKEGNLKLSKEDNINPALMGKLEKIEIELKKGNEMSELDLKMAAHGLDAEMSHNAAETRDQQRLISALMVRNPDRSIPMTGE